MVYDARANQRFAFEITEGGEKFRTAHIFKPLTDERYIKFLKDTKIRGEKDKLEQEVNAAQISLWRDLIDSIENVDVAVDTDFRDLVDADVEMIPAINAFLPVSIWEPDTTSDGKRTLGGNLVVTTEALFSGQLVYQKHTLKRKTDEFAKMYDRLVDNEYRREKIGGLRREVAMEYHPQAKARGELYDKMFVSVEGFAGSKATDVPLRFKTVVINSIFQAALVLDPKK